MKAVLYLVRHGETTANRDDILQGQCDYPLTELGIQQAVSRGESLQGMKWDHVFASDLTRAFRTAEVILSTAGCDLIPINQTALIRELSFGVRENLPRSMNLAQAKLEVATRLNIPVEEVVDTAETIESATMRQAEFLTRLKTHATSPDREPARILCVSHGKFIKTFLKAFCPAVQEVSKIGHCAVSIVHVCWPAEDNSSNSHSSVTTDSINNSSNSTNPALTTETKNEVAEGVDAEVERAVARARQGVYAFQCHARPEEINMCLNDS